MARLDGWERACLVLILAGGALRFAFLGGHSIEGDGAYYVSMGKMLVENGEFIEPWNDPPTYSWHFPPLFPAYLSLFLAAFGYSYVSVKIAGAIAGVTFIAVVYACTNSLYGRRAALAVTAIAAVMPTFVFYDREILSETFVAMLFAVTIWGILKSLDDPRYILVAGVFAGLGFLAKASMGPFFLLAGAAGFTWRFAYVRWNVFRDTWYLLGAGLFALLVLPWSMRNVLRHGWPHWQTQKLAQDALDTLFATPGWPGIVLLAAAWATFLILLHALPFLPGIQDLRKDLRSARTSGLIMAIVTPVLVSSFFIAAFSVVEGWSIVKSSSPMRYAVTPFIPLLWLCMPRLDLSSVRLDGPPTEGKQRIRTELVLVSLGTAVLAVTLALRYPWLIYQSATSAILLLAGLAIGVGLLLASRGAGWRPHLRQKQGVLEWRAVKDGSGWVVALLAPVLLIIGLLMRYDLMPVFIATAGAVAVRSWRARVVVVAVVLLSWSIGGAVYQWPVPEIESDLAELAREGDTLAIQIGYERWFYPFAPEAVEIVPWAANATFRIQKSDDPPPSGYAVASRRAQSDDLSPGGALRVWIEKDVDVQPPIFDLYVVTDRPAGT